MRKAVIVLPTYNESGNIKALVEAIFAQQSNIPNWEVHVTVVDSASPDNTAKIVQELIGNGQQNLHLVQTKKEGLGKAYLDGFSWCIKNIDADVLFEMDADFSHNPKDIPEFLKKIDAGADMVLGTRYSLGGSIPSNWGLHRKIFSLFGNVFVKYGFLKPNITDWTGGFRAIKKEVVRQIAPKMMYFTGYVFQVAFLDNAVKLKVKIAETPIHFTDRINGKSKINAPQYILNTFKYVILNSSFIKFVIVGGTGAVIDFGLAAILKYGVGLGISLSNIISAETSIVSNFLLNNYWSFKDKKVTGRQGIIKNFAKFNLISLGNIVIQVIGINILSGIFGPTYWLVYKALVIGLVVIPYSYLMYNKVIWKKKDD